MARSTSRMPSIMCALLVEPATTISAINPTMASIWISRGSLARIGRSRHASAATRSLSFFDMAVGPGLLVLGHPKCATRPLLAQRLLLTTPAHDLSVLLAVAEICLHSATPNQGGDDD